jgi:hypothetical protein
MPIRSRVPLLLVALTTLAAAPTPAHLKSTPVPLPGGSGGIGFDDLTFVPELGRLVVPAGRSGNLDLLDPATGKITPIGGFQKSEAGKGGHGEGTTSADFGRGRIFAIDRSALKLVVVDPKTGKTVASAALASSPDYVRFVAPDGEVWVTEPDSERIEVFTLAKTGEPVPTHASFIAVPGGPEALQIDAARGRAYTHVWKGTTLAVDLESHEIVSRWSSGCAGSRGAALDAKRGFLFVGCAEGGAAVLDLGHDGKVLDDFHFGAGTDIIAFDAKRSRLYVPAAKTAEMAILSVSPQGKLALLATAPTAKGGHCVAIDGTGRAWVCDPEHGQLLLIRDTLPASPR